jgi:exodeoxyribonuclease V alpha subunit
VSALPGADPRDARRVVGATGALRAFNVAGVLAAADLHVARALGELAHVDDEDVLLATALAVRGPRLGHVRVDLATIRDTAAVDADETVDVSALPWPEPDSWLDKIAAAPFVARGDEDPADDRPLRLVAGALYLDRYWREERQVAADLAGLAVAADAVEDGALDDGIRRLFGDEADGRQARAAATAVRRRLTVVAGGPGTGKTTTVARIVALLAEQAAALGRPAPHVALAAPTGKAAARLQEAVHQAAGGLDTTRAVRDQLRQLEASTLHRLLGWRPGSHSRFRHDRANRLPHDVVLVDETSMVSLSLMARLVEAVRPDARLVLVGDPGQLTSIEAGVVLGDVVGPAADGRPHAHDGPVADGIVVLDHGYRFGTAITDLATAIRRGDGDAGPRSGVATATPSSPP